MPYAGREPATGLQYVGEPLVSDVFGVQLGAFEFPDAAGGMQRSGQYVALLRELSDRYQFYHGRLAAELDGFGGPPDWSDYAGDDQKYAHDWARAQSLVRAEALLRVALRVRAAGAREIALPLDEPLVDEQYRLVSAV